MRKALVGLSLVFAIAAGLAYAGAVRDDDSGGDGKFLGCYTEKGQTWCLWYAGGYVTAHYVKG